MRRPSLSRWSGCVAAMSCALLVPAGLATAREHHQRLQDIRFPVYRDRVTAPLVQPVIYQDGVSCGDARPSANALYQQGLARRKAGDFAGARRFFEAALAREPDNTVIRASLGYILYDAGDLKAARRVFEETLRRDPSATMLYDQLGYLNLRLGDKEQADEWFRKAIDHHRDVSPATSGQAAARNERIYQLRYEVAQAENDFDATLYSIFRRGSGNGAPNPTGRSLTQSQGGAEGSCRLPIPGLGAGRMVQAFGRVLWSYKRDSLAIRSASYQGGIGLRAKPFARQNLIVSFERLVSLGRDARDDWLARIGYSWSKGAGFDPFHKSWLYLSVYGDAALAFPTGPDLFLTGELRAGRSWRVGDHFSVTPHLVLIGSRQEDGPVTTRLIEAGPGIALKYYFDELTYRAAGASAELLLQYRAKVGGNSTGTSGAAATFVVTF